MPPATQSYRNAWMEPLPDLRALISSRPEALYLETRVLAAMLRCSEPEAEEARLWIAGDGLEVAA